MGYGLAARYEYQAELVLLQRLARDRPQDLGLLRDLAGAHRTLAGHAQRDGDYAAVQREQLAEVAVLRQLALADPATGDLLRAAMAAAATESAAADRSAGTEAGPAGEAVPPEPGQQCRDLADLADRALAVGDRNTAEVSYRALVGVRERLAAASPGQVQAQLNLADAHRRLSDCYAAGGRPGAAQTSCLAELAVRAALAAATPADGARQEILASGYGRLAGLAEAAGDLAAAQAAVQSEVIIRGWLAAAQLGDWQLGALAEAEARLAELAGPDGAADG
jgi:hypothetical protein